MTKEELLAKARKPSEDAIIAEMDEPDAFIDEAVAVGMKAQEQGVARLAVSEEALRRNAEEMICSAQDQARALTESGCIE
jgi:malate dehydrogenase (oxaloacetate-decarboxylating)